ncbi:hypothetical protein B0H21DRAFT_565632 [Amylocystis lapponica]|nr:hypothetical protein B0H21DRAFT_565632 [Amylocystis lapponica]
MAMLPTRYYQIGGYQGHYKDIPDTLAQKFVGSNPDGVDLVLGIRPSGASYVLISQAQTEKIFGRPSYGSFWPAERFISLSPIHFATAEELATKLKAMTSKRTNKNEPRDRSKANTTYTTGGDGPSDKGTARAAFEHQRVLFRLCRREQFEPAHYALQPSPRLCETRVIALTYNLWTLDLRPLRDRMSDPFLLDFGWTEFTLPTASREFTATSSKHFVIEERRTLHNPRVVRSVFQNGSTENIIRSALDAQVQRLFAQLDPAQPILLFVHNEQATRAVLASLGVDTIQWKSGISDLLYRGADRAQRDPYNDRDRDRRQHEHNSWRDRGGYYPSRSRSPRRAADDRGRPRSPPPAPRRAAVHFVDVREMYLTLKDIVSTKDSINTNAIDLGIKLPQCTMVNNRGTDGQKPPAWLCWCAGNESRVLGQMWNTMVSDRTIDEQRIFRWSSELDTPLGGASTASTDALQATAEDDDEENFDPNDAVVPMGQAGGSASGAQGGAGQPAPEWDSDSDSDWD